MKAREPQTLLKGEKIAQAIVVPCLVSAKEEDSLEALGETERGHGGFGSSGKF
ncbi:MAG: hypothetical protein ACOX3T_05455 [Bdellovibrionota bacterium]